MSTVRTILVNLLPGLLTPGRLFTGPTLARAEPYVGTGAITSLEVTEDQNGITLSAAVQGTWDYDVDITMRVARTGGGVTVHTDCTCPIGEACKHCAAVLTQWAELIGASRTVGERSPSWSKPLDRLLSGLDETAARGDRRPLAVQVAWVETRGYRMSIRSVVIRPMQRGVDGKRWIKTGAQWRDFIYPHSVDNHDPAQRALIRELSVAMGSAVSYGQIADAPLADASAMVWPLLRRAEAVGVQLVSDHNNGRVRLLAERAALQFDVTESRDGQVAVGAMIATSDGAYPAEDAIFAGGRRGAAHGFAVMGEVEGVRTLTLGEFATAIPQSVISVVQGGQMTVPAAARERLIGDHLVRLRRYLPVTSSDHSVTLPPDPDPQLVLTVSWPDVARAELKWTWRYGETVDAPRFRLNELPVAGGLRNVELERKVLAGLAMSEPADRLLRDDTGALTPQRFVAGADAIELAADVLPELEQHPDILMEKRDQAPDFRPAESAPELTFTAVEDDSEGSGIDWLDLEVSVQVDGERVALPDVLAAMARSEDVLILPSGRYVDLHHPDLARLAELVASARQLHDQLHDPDGQRLRVSALDVDTLGEVAQLGSGDSSLGPQAAEWIRRAQALRDIEELPDYQPVGLATELRHYQLDGFRWLCFLHEHGLGGILADDMGLGKTLQVLAMIQRARGLDTSVARSSRRTLDCRRPFLVVAPTSVVGNWEAEARRHTPDLVVRTVTSSSKRLTQPIAELAADADIVVTSYTLLRLDEEQYAGLEWSGLLLDEAQQIKNHRSKGYQAARRIDAPIKIAITGTPFENRLMELWSLLSIVTPGLYSDAKRFTSQVAKPVEKQGDEQALRRFQRRIKPFLLRRTKDLVASELPPKQEQVLALELSARHRRIYDTHLQRERQRILGLLEDYDNNAVEILAALTKLRLMALHPALVDPEHAGVPSAKLDALVEHLQELADEGHRALVFSQFTGFLRLVRDRLTEAGLETAYLDGRTRARQRVIDGFKQGTATAFLISLKAGGVGLTLTEADYVFVLDPWWNPAVEAQAVDRAHRIGQTKPVLVYRYVAGDTIEEKVMELKARKAALFRDVVDGQGEFGQGLSADDLRGLFG